MNVPLSVNPTVEGNNEKLKIWFNGEEEVIDAPIKPYYYAIEQLNNPGKVSRVDKKALSNYQPKSFLKYEFKTRKELVKYRVKGKTFEDNIPFVLRNRLDDPDIYVDFPHTNKLNFLFLDIEQYIKPDKMSPMYNDRIISIAWCGNDRKIKCAYITKERKDDRKLLEFFIQDYNKINPDVIVCYNKKYDVPTILNRCKQVGIDTSRFSKNHKKPYVGGKEAVNIDGVDVYDVYLSAKADQSLNGNVANRGLKAVSDYFGFEKVIEPLDTKQTHKYVGTKDLVKYNKDDVKRLLLLFDIYWSNIEFNANDLKIPLNSALELNTTDLGIVVMGDEYRKDGIIADGTNQYRYPEIFQVKREGGKYEGALVGIHKTGLFEPIYKADFSSMYPSIMSSFNLSPDVVTLVRYDRYSRFKIEEKDDHFIYHIPDKILNKTMVLKVLKKIGFMSQLVGRFLQERSEYKKLWKQTGEKKYRAISDNRKVKANGGAYGNQGALNHPYGFAPIAVATCGIGRESAQLLVDILNKLYPKSVIETDSVTGDTPIFIRSKKTKEIDIIPIEDLSDGSLRNIIREYKTLTRSGWKELQYVYCHNVNKTICTIDTSQSRIDVTSDHSLFSNEKEVSPKDLKSGDIIDIYPAKDYEGSNEELNEDQAWFLGFFVSDGSIVVRNRAPKGKEWTTYELSLVKQKIQLLEKSKDILEKEFDIKSKIYDTLKSGSVYRLNDIKQGRSNKESILYLRSMCYCNDKKTKKVPKQILNAPINIVDGFFRGLTDGDGFVGTIEKEKGKWKIASKFKPLAAGICYLLDRKKETYNIACRTDKINMTNIQTHKPKHLLVKKRRPFNHPGTITKIMKEKKEQYVYDLSTEDGTFIAGIGRVICHNTDGVYFHTDNIDKEKIYEIFDKSILNKFKKELNLSIDIDDYDKGYFYKTKNYVLQRGKNLIFHGVAMKASSKNNISRLLINELARATLNEEPTGSIVREYRKLDFGLKDFAMSVTLGMRLRDYKNKNAIAPQMAIYAERKLDIPAVAGTQYHYIKTHNGYKLLDISKKSDIDGDYYLDQVNRIIKMFDAENVRNNLDKWL